MKRHLVAMLYSGDMSLEGLQQELEECKNDDVSTLFINASGCNNFILVAYWKKKWFLMFFLEVYTLMIPFPPLWPLF